MTKENLETLIKATGNFIKTHKAPLFLAGGALYASSWYFDYKAVISWKEHHPLQAIAYGAAGRATSLSGIAVAGAPVGFYYTKKILGRKWAAKTFRFLQEVSAYVKIPRYGL